MSLQQINHLNLSSREAQEIMDMFAQTTDCRLFDNDKKCDAEQLRRLREAWHKDGAITVFKAGVFDLLHNNHLLFLVHLRLIGAREYLTQIGIQTPTQAQLLDVACSDKVRVILTVDSDERVRASKGFMLNKGYSPRPTLSWENRVMMLSHQQIMVQGKGKTLVDAITRHGTNACKLQDCPHQDDSDLASYLHPDVLVINKDNKSAVERARNSKSRVVIVNETQLAFTDTRLGGTIKTSAIINRVKQTISKDVSL